jgi:hypothetical protein
MDEPNERNGLLARSQILQVFVVTFHSARRQPNRTAEQKENNTTNMRLVIRASEAMEQLKQPA